MPVTSAALLAHDLKGNGESYGFPDLSTRGSELEAAAIKADPEAVASQIAQLAHYLARVELVDAPEVPF